MKTKFCAFNWLLIGGLLSCISACSPTSIPTSEQSSPTENLESQPILEDQKQSKGFRPWMAWAGLSVVGVGILVTGGILGYPLLQKVNRKKAFEEAWEREFGQATGGLPLVFGLDLFDQELGRNDIVDPDRKPMTDNKWKELILNVWMAHTSYNRNFEECFSPILDTHGKAGRVFEHDFSGFIAKMATLLEKEKVNEKVWDQPEYYLKSVFTNNLTPAEQNWSPEYKSKVFEQYKKNKPKMSILEMAGINTNIKALLFILWALNKMGYQDQIR